MDSENDKRLPRIESWSVRDGQIRYRLEVSFDDVTLKESTPPPSPFMDGFFMSGTHEELIEGKLHDEVRRIFGEDVLEEALAIARHNISLKRPPAN